MYRTILALSLTVLALFLAACGGSAVVEEEAVEELIVVNMNDIYFGESNDNVNNPPIWRVSPSSEVTIRMENMGALEHNWAVLKAGESIPIPFDETDQADKILFSAGNVAGGASNEVSFTAPEVGEYNVVCTVPGHAALMQGRLIVEG